MQQYELAGYRAPQAALLQSVSIRHSMRRDMRWKQFTASHLGMQVNQKTCVILSREQSPPMLSTQFSIGHMLIFTLLQLLI
jgi:hypothetical protein